MSLFWNLSKKIFITFLKFNIKKQNLIFLSVFQYEQIWYLFIRIIDVRGRSEISLKLHRGNINTVIGYSGVTFLFCSFTFLPTIRKWSSRMRIIKYKNIKGKNLALSIYYPREIYIFETTGRKGIEIKDLERHHIHRFFVVKFTAAWTLQWFIHSLYMALL